MANLIELSDPYEADLDHFSARLYRIKVHKRREELRAARAQLNGLAEELILFLHELELPREYVLVGANVGLFSGKGSWLRGRLPGAAFGAAAGWLVGHAILMRQRRRVRELLEEAILLENELGLRPPRA